MLCEEKSATFEDVRYAKYWEFLQNIFVVADKNVIKFGGKLLVLTTKSHLIGNVMKYVQVPTLEAIAEKHFHCHKNHHHARFRLPDQHDSTVNRF